MAEVTAIVLAAGQGRRMKSTTPKQFIEAGGRPMIAYSLETFERSAVDEIILVTGSGDIDYCRSQIIEKYGISKCKDIVAGADVRAMSVYNGLMAASGEYVLIHDGARPLVSDDIIEDTIYAVREYGAAVPVVEVKDTIREVSGTDSLGFALDRNALAAMQTPQALRRSDLLEAYSILLSRGCDFSNVTDDIMIVEQGLGMHAHLVDGSEMNRKITTPEDLEWFKTILRDED